MSANFIFGPLNGLALKVGVCEEMAKALSSCMWKAFTAYFAMMVKKI